MQQKFQTDDDIFTRVVFSQRTQSHHTDKHFTPVCRSISVVRTQSITTIEQQ